MTRKRIVPQSKTVIHVRRSGDDPISVTIGDTKNRFDWRRAASIVTVLAASAVAVFVIMLGNPQQAQAAGAFLRVLLTGTPSP